MNGVSVYQNARMRKDQGEGRSNQETDTRSRRVRRKVESGKQRRRMLTRVGLGLQIGGEDSEGGACMDNENEVYGKSKKIVHVRRKSATQKSMQKKVK
jgi:hypothetical protein